LDTSVSGDGEPLVSDARGRRSHRGDQVAAVEEEVAALTHTRLSSSQEAGNRVNTGIGPREFPEAVSLSTL